MKKRGFSHLHIHTEYSILDGLIRIEELVKWTKENGSGYVAITDHGNLYGAVQFYQEAKEAGLKPLIGIEAYISPTHRTDKNLPKGESNNHIVLFAADSVGYKNLMKLTTQSFTEGFHYRPRIDLELLHAYNEGIIATSACLRGRVNSMIVKGRMEDARKTLKEYVEVFGKDRFFLEYMNHGIPEQIQLRPHIEKLSDEFSIPIIATNDAHYIRSSDSKYQDVMMCVQMNKKISDPDRLKFYNDQFYLKNYDEMLNVVEGKADWLRNCDLVAKQIDFKMELGKFHFPNFETPDGLSTGDHLKKISNEGLQKKFKGRDIPREYMSRLEYELGAIIKLGFAPYFLIIEDFVRFALESGIPKGPGRGSGAASLVSYSLGITDIDPIEYQLLFERFINPARKSMPDMDLDFDPLRREEVIEYVRNKYHPDYVCNIVTFNRMKARAAVRDSARVLDIPLSEADLVSKMIPFGNTIDEGLEANEELLKKYETEPGIKKWLDTAKAIEGLVRNVGVHPAGVVIADKPVVEYAPLMLSEKDGARVCQYHMNNVDAIGLIKMDFLGLRTLSYMKECIGILKKTKNVDIEPMEIPLDDEKTYRLLCEANTLGVFQLESFGMRDLMRNIRPDWIGDVIALIALYRPGPMKQAPHFANRKHGNEKIEYAHPDLKPILDETYGVITYQEQITMILVKLAGIDLSDAVTIIKIISKKREAAAIDRYREEFVKGTSKKGIDESIANEIFDSIVEFAGYGFNKAHSAAYGLLAYWTAFLKANYPTEFYCAFLSSEMHDTDKISEILSELRKEKIDILPPDVNESRGKFKVENNAIRFGLVAIKGVGSQAVNEIVEARKDGVYKDLGDFTSRVNLFSVNRGSIVNLIKSGAMDSLPGNRAQKVDAVDRFVEIGKKVQDDREKGQSQLFDFSDPGLSGGTHILKPVDEFPREMVLRMEKQLTGFYLTGHPLEPFWGKMQEVKNYRKIEKLEGLGDGTEVVIGGLITYLEFKISKRLEQYAVMKVEDFTGSVEVMVFPRTLTDEIKEHLVQESVLMMSGRIKSEIKETQSEDGETTETKYVKVFLDSAQKHTNPATEIDLPKVSDIGLSRVQSAKTQTMELDYSSGIKKPDRIKREIVFHLPIESSKLLEIGERLKEIVDRNAGDADVKIYFEMGPGRFRADLGIKGVDFEKVKEQVEGEFADVSVKA